MVFVVMWEWMIVVWFVVVEKIMVSVLCLWFVSGMFMKMMLLCMWMVL